jgi:hypothetical protein
MSSQVIVQEYKYLRYIISSKPGWGKLIKETGWKVRKRVALIRSFKLYGCSSPGLRKALLYSHVLPIFTWIYPIYPLLTRNQQDGLSRFYYTSLRRTLSSLTWLSSIPSNSSIPHFEMYEIELLHLFPDSFC